MGLREKAGSAVKQAVPFFWVSNIEDSVRYYTHGLGFKKTREWEKDGSLRWCWLQNGDAALMLQEIETEGCDAWAPTGRMGEGVSIFFICDDALEVYRDVTSRGIKASRPFVGNAMWVTYMRDPDGFGIAFESETDEPEGTEYSEDEVQGGASVR